jgi:hypothetical protein
MAVYFIQAGGPEGPVKIGKAGNPLDRLSDLQVGNHEPLELIHVVHGGLEREAAIHSMFEPLLGRKEWFYFDQKMLRVPEFQDAAPLPPDEIQRRLDVLHLRSRICPGCGCSHSRPGTLYCSDECVELDPYYQPKPTREIASSPPRPARRAYHRRAVPRGAGRWAQKRRRVGRARPLVSGSRCPGIPIPPSLA